MISSIQISSNNLLITINNERIKRNLKPLKFNSIIEVVAQAHSNDMFLRKKMTHRSKNGSNVGNRLIKQGYNFSWCGEIIAYDTNPNVINLWINSPEHNAIMFSKIFDEFGIGITGPYYTVDFGKRL